MVTGTQGVPLTGLGGHIVVGSNVLPDMSKISNIFGQKNLPRFKMLYYSIARVDGCYPSLGPPVEGLAPEMNVSGLIINPCESQLT